MECSAIVLAAGSRKTLGSAIKKQYLEIQGMPVLGIQSAVLCAAALYKGNYSGDIRRRNRLLPEGDRGQI